jgi:hypothetical protein
MLQQTTKRRLSSSDARNALSTRRPTKKCAMARADLTPRRTLMAISMEEARKRLGQAFRSSCFPPLVIKLVARPGSRTECLTSIVSAAGSAKNTRSAVAAQRLRAPGTQCVNLGARGGVGRFRLEHLTIGQQSA